MVNFVATWPRFFKKRLGFVLAFLFLVVAQPSVAASMEPSGQSFCAHETETFLKEMTVGSPDLSHLAERRKHAYETLNAAVTAQFSQPELKWILNDPDKFMSEIEQRFKTQKLLTPKTPYQFDYSEFGLPLLKDMDKQLVTKIQTLKDLKLANPSNAKFVKEVDTAILYLNDLTKEVHSHLDAGKISYQDLNEVSFFFSRAIGHFDARSQKLIPKLYLWSDNVLSGYEQFPIDREYEMYKKREFSVFTKAPKTGGFIRTGDYFEQAFYDPEKLRMIIVPTNAELNRDIFMRLNHHNIYFIGVTDTPIPADGIDRPGGHFWNHDIRHSTVMFYKRENYFKSLHLSSEREAELKKQMDVWYLDLLDGIDHISDPKLKDAVVFFQFNHHHEKGFPLVPSQYLAAKPNKDPYLLYLMMETNHQKTSFGPKYINRAYQWLKAFWDVRAPEERALTAIPSAN